MGLFADIFGGTDKSAQKAQIRANQATGDVIQQAADRARADVLRIFPQAQLAQQRGFQGAADIFGQALPEQARLLEGGNLAAQQTQLGGLGAAQNALLGLGSGFQDPTSVFGVPASLSPDLGFAQAPSGLGSVAPPPAAPQQFDLQQLIQQQIAQQFGANFGDVLGAGENSGLDFMRGF